MKKIPKALFVALALLLNACSTVSQSTEGVLQIEVSSRGQALVDVSCYVRADKMSTTVNAPAKVNVGLVHDILEVRCEKPGYKTAEIIYRAAPRNLSPQAGLGVQSGGGANFSIALKSNATPVFFPSPLRLDMPPVK